MIPVCYFPSQVILVDDDPDFLSNLTLLLDESQSTYVTFQSAKKALDYIESEVAPLNLDSAFLEEKESYELGKDSFYLNYSAIKNTALNPSRFAGLSVVIADYNMPNMNGLDFLKSIKTKHVKKILLTGEADESTAINAFNDGIINRFIKKQDPELSQTVIKSINSLQRRAFLELTQKTFPPSKALTNNPIFQNIPELEAYFFDILKKHNIVEYYLIDSQGTYLLLDKHAKASGLFIRNEDYFTFLENEVFGEAEISESIQKDIENRKSLLCYLPTTDQLFPEDHEITKYLQPATTIEYEEGKLYAAYLPEFINFNDSEFSSFNDFSASQA